jgi:hypothetical protein
VLKQPLSNQFLKTNISSNLKFESANQTLQNRNLTNALNGTDKGKSGKSMKAGSVNQGGFDDAESTDASRAGDTIPSRPTAQAPVYDWSEVAYLFEDEIIPAELLQITDPIEYNYLIVRLKKDFNEKHRSDYLRYMHLDLPYHSRRDEVGGVITAMDWSAFTRRLEGVIEKIDNKRKRIIARRKKRGKKLMPRKTLFKPKKREKLEKNPLWQEVFMKDSSDDDDGSVSDLEDQEVFNMYRDAMKAKGIKTAVSRPNAAALMNLTAQSVHHIERPC